MPRRKIRFLTDEDVPDSVGDFLRGKGHHVVRVREAEMLTGSPDKVVAAAARESDHVLVTHNYKDFRRVVRDHLESTNAKVDSLCVVELECGQVTAAQRISEELDLIVREFSRRREDPSKGVRISITRQGFRVAR